MKVIDKDTIAVRLLGETLMQWHGQGRDTGALLIQAGIDPELLNKPYARVSAQAYL